MRTRLVLARVAVGLALTTGLTGAGGAAAMAVGTEDPTLCIAVGALGGDCSGSTDPAATQPAPAASTSPEDAESTPTPTESTPADTGATEPAPVQPSTQPTSTPSPTPTASPTPTPSPSPAPAPATTGGTSAGASSAGPSSGSTAQSTATESSAPSAAVASAAPPAQVAPSGPALTSVESTAAGEAVERVRETQPTSAEPSTRLLAEPVASGSGLPSPKDSGLLALIVAMGAASIGCAVAALLLRGREKARHLS